MDEKGEFSARLKKQISADINLLSAAFLKVLAYVSYENVGMAITSQLFACFDTKNTL
jgi:hypothetical protein